jgi:hypothetical protein
MTLKSSRDRQGFYPHRIDEIDRAPSSGGWAEALKSCAASRIRPVLSTARPVSIGRVGASPELRPVGTEV